MYSRFSRISAGTPITNTTTTSHAPSVNFTIANTTTTIAVRTPAEKLITKRLRQLSSRCVRWYFAMPNPAMAKAVNTPIA